MKFSEEKMRAVLSLPAPKRYSHFVKVAADQDCIWGLYSDGWALMETDEGGKVFPVWPAEGYAQLFTTDLWKTYTPRKIALSGFFNELIPLLKSTGTKVGVFPVDADKGVVADFETLVADLRQELGRVE